MRSTLTRSSRAVCQLCTAIPKRQISTGIRLRSSLQGAVCSLKVVSTQRRALSSSPRLSIDRGKGPARKLKGEPTPLRNFLLHETDFPTDLAREHQLQYLIDSIQSAEDTILLIKRCGEIATEAISPQDIRRSVGPDEIISGQVEDVTPESELLSLADEKPKTPAPVARPLTDKEKEVLVEFCSDIAFRIVREPKVFVTPEILNEYVALQTYLSRPQSLPEVFDLFASKPVLEQKSEGGKITIKEQNPNKVASAIPEPLAEAALQAAMRVKDLPAALSIVDTTYGTTAYRKSKFVRRALIPLGGVVALPFAAWMVATSLAGMQDSWVGDSMDPGMFKGVAFAGIMGYVGFTGVIGMVALTTANDQMERVTWVTGIPLRERWVREEERAAIDRIAMAWGFKERDRRGEEEGEEWQELRNWIGRKGMILDKVELMDGME
jgi:hypothetical protein